MRTRTCSPLCSTRCLRLPTTSTPCGRCRRGPTDLDKPELGGFYELETSSPAAALKPNESLSHTHRTFHFQGDLRALDAISRSVLGVSLSDVKGAL